MKERKGTEGEGVPRPHWWVYFLRLADGSLYCGCTVSLEERLAMHARGAGSRLVRAKSPFALAYAERVCGTRSEAQAREAALKRLGKADKEKLCAAWAQIQVRDC